MPLIDIPAAGIEVSLAAWFSGVHKDLQTALEVNAKIMFISYLQK
jgi:hypothetical protein